MRILFACAVAVALLTSSAYGGQWVSSTTNHCTGADKNNDGKSTWDLSAGAQGLGATATVSMIDYWQETMYTSPASLQITVDRTDKWEWKTCTNEEPAARQFTLRFTGNVFNTSCSATAEEIDDYAFGEEQSKIDVTSPEFQDSDLEKWATISKRGVELEANPVQGKESSVTDTQKISYGTGLPVPQLTGDITWSFVQMLRDRTRVKSGQEASSTIQAGASTAVYNHPGGGTNLDVEATVVHFGTVTIKGRSGDGKQWFDDPDYEADSTAKATTTAFSVQ